MHALYYMSFSLCIKKTECNQDASMVTNVKSARPRGGKFSEENFIPFLSLSCVIGDLLSHTNKSV